MNDTTKTEPPPAGGSPLDGGVGRLVERLRTRNGRPDGFGLGPVCDEAADEIERLRSAPFWWRCDTHGMALPHNAWGCPDCVRELRDENLALRRAIERACAGYPNDAAAPTCVAILREALRHNVPHERL